MIQVDLHQKSGPKSGIVNNQKGQSTVEFALTLILFMAFTLFYFQLSMVMAFGNFAHYATFMSARALLSAGYDAMDQKDRSRLVIVKMLKKSEGQAGVDKFPSIARGFGGGGEVGGLSNDPPDNFQPHVRDFSWMQGVRYTFRSKVFVIPLAGMGSAGKADTRPTVNTLTLTSESWLGRETSYMECQNEMGKFSGLFDNGC
ncbi:MAG: pilus assembly protein [Bdellovibrio sp.]|nr:pilus assembly protein [Bdellovibrio sp.]